MGSFIIIVGFLLFASPWKCCLGFQEGRWLQRNGGIVDSVSSRPVLGLASNSLDDNDDVELADLVLPPPPAFRPKPLPLLLAGGLFLFGNSVAKEDQKFTQQLLDQAQKVLRINPTVAMELGQNVESGGVYSSLKQEKVIEISTSTMNKTIVVEQLVLQFQIEGGNSWAQGVAYGIRRPAFPCQNERHATTVVQLLELEVANMDATINGTPLEIQIPTDLRGA